MTLTIRMDEELARRLATEARRQGVDSQEYARRLIEEKVGPREATPSNRRRWSSSPSGIARTRPTTRPRSPRREEELKELKKALNENRGSGRV